MTDEPLQTSFWLSEFLRSETATRQNTPNEPDAVALGNIKSILAPRMQRVRDLLRFQVHILSGYRSPTLNKLVGGADPSQHTEGLAADFVAPGFGSPKAIAKFLVDHALELQYDKLIFEGTWVHISFSKGTARKQVLSATFEGGRTTYSPGLA